MDSCDIWYTLSYDFETDKINLNEVWKWDECFDCIKEYDLSQKDIALKDFIELNKKMKDSNDE